MRRQARTLIIIGVLSVLAFLVLGIQSFKVAGIERGGDTLLGLTLGLDLQGGSHLVYRVVSDVPPTSDDMAALRRILERRVNKSGLGEPIIQVLGDDRLLIQLPGVKDPARAKEIIGETALLEIKHRTLNVPRDIEGVELGDIIEVRVTTEEAEAERIVRETQATSTEGAATTTEATAVNATTTDATSTPAVSPAETATGTPMLVVTFTPDAGDRFGEFIDGLRASLEPVPGSGEILPSYLTVARADDSLTGTRVPYTLFVLAPDLSVVPLGGAPLIQRVDDGPSFHILLPETFVPPETFSALTEGLDGGTGIVLTEIAGRVDEDIGLTGDDLARAYAGQHQGSGVPIVNLEFNGEGTRKFGLATTRIAGTSDMLAIFLDDEELIAPTVQTPITGGAAFIQGRDFTIDRVRDIALLLEAGRLPLPIEISEERDVDAILGADSLAKSARAGVIGLALVLLFMTVYYRVPGLVAAVALVLYAAFVLAIFKLLPVTLTLSGVAAAILSIGMAVDANILIFERMKDELRSGRTFLSAINLGFNRAWPAIRDGNVSTLITCAILFWFADTLGATIVQGFAITLAIGVGMSMFSAIVVSRTLLRVMAATRLSRHLGWFVPVKGAELPQQQPRGQTA